MRQLICAGNWKMHKTAAEALELIDGLLAVAADFPAGVDVVVASRESGAPEVAWGDTFFFDEPSRQLAPDRKFPFATIVTRDYGDFDCASHLNRPGVFRLNIGIGKTTFLSLFASQPSPASENVHDFTALDRLMPHPVYGQMNWVCVLNPSDETFQKLSPLLAEAYELAAKKHAKPH